MCQNRRLYLFLVYPHFLYCFDRLTHIFSYIFLITFLFIILWCLCKMRKTVCRINDVLHNTMILLFHKMVLNSLETEELSGLSLRYSVYPHLVNIFLRRSVFVGDHKLVLWDGQHLGARLAGASGSAGLAWKVGSLFCSLVELIDCNNPTHLCCSSVPILSHLTGDRPWLERESHSSEK